jgi:hypothetical protein
MSMPQPQDLPTDIPHSIDTTGFVRAGEQPEQANKIVAEATKPQEIAAPELPDLHVTLPGGLVRPSGEVADQVEVRELNGEDEESLARLGSVPLPRFISEILKRCVVSIGGEKPEPIEIDSLLVGDRDALMVAVRRATYGDDLEMTVTCPYCTTDWSKPKTFDVAIELDKDIPQKEMEEKAKRLFLVELRRGEAEVQLVTGLDQAEAIGDGNRSTPQHNTVLLSRCVKKLNGSPIINTSTVLKMGSADRMKILSVLVDKQPGPQLMDVKVPCSMCGEEVPTPLGMGDFFRF